MNIKYLLIFLLFNTFNLSANVCYTQKLKNKPQINKAQKCLIQEIKKSIHLARMHDEYHTKVLNSIKSYSDLKLLCKRYEIAAEYSTYNKKYYLKKFRRLNKKKIRARKTLRRLENQYGYIGTRYHKFKEQIRQLELELELIEIDYGNIINN